MQTETIWDYQPSGAVTEMPALSKPVTGSGELSQDESPDIVEWSGQSLATPPSAFVYAGLMMMMAIAGPSASAHNFGAFEVHLPRRATAVDQLSQHKHDSDADEAALRSPAFRQCEEKLLKTLEANPVEDGYTHAGEHILAEAFANQQTVAGIWAMRVVEGGVPRPEAAAVLRLLARLSPVDEGWRARLVTLGLKSHDVEVRDAAMQAVEYWADAAGIEALRAHQDPVPWLRDYADQILNDLVE